MEVHAFRFDLDAGWSVRPLPPAPGPRTLVLAFGGLRAEEAAGPLAELRAAYPEARILGCSTAGEIQDGLIHDRSLVVTVAAFEAVALRVAVADVGGPEATAAAAGALADQLADPGLRGVLVLSDGLLVNGSALIGALNARLPAGIPITGGLAGDGDRFQATWVAADGPPRPGCIAAVGLCGPGLRMAWGSRGGWDTFGPARRVTRSEGNVLFELDGKPALALYKTYLGDRASALPASALLFPLALRGGEGEEVVVRTILAVDEAAQSLTFAGDIPQGGLAQLMRANLDRLIDGAEEAARGLGQADLAPALSIAISCVGRRLVLGERTEEEVEAALEGLPPGTRQVGFYSYGELSPLASGTCTLHNQTMTLTVLQESPGP